MAITGVMRAGYVQVRVTDMDASIVHYRDRIGLSVVHTGEDGRVYLKAYDEFDHHSVILRPADEPGLDFMGFRVRNEDDLTELTDKLYNHGVAVDHLEAGSQPALGRVVSFTIPAGHTIHLYSEMAIAERTPPTHNPDVWDSEPRGMRATRMDHCLLYGPNIAETVELFTEVLGFELAEVVIAPDGSYIAPFLTCASKAHDVAFVHHDDPGIFHHVSFYLESWNDVAHAGDVMSRYDIPVDIGPTRHGITRGQTIYFWDPSGNRNEVFSGGYIYFPDNPQRTWDAEQLAKGVFYVDRRLNEAFLNVYT